MYYLSSETIKNFPFRGRRAEPKMRGQPLYTGAAVKPPRLFYSTTFIKKAVPQFGGRKTGNESNIKNERAFEVLNKLKAPNSQAVNEYKPCGYQL